ncbi:MAG: hypothetical protein ACOC2O_02775 [Bacillota bacterium]
MIIGKAPGRAGIIGNPTDGYGGAMIACSIPYFARTIIRDDEQLRLIVDGKEEIIKWETDLKLQDDSFDLLRSILRYFKLTDLKACIEIKSDIPRQAGLAGSTAILSAALGAVLKKLNRKHNPYYLAELNRNIELRYMKTHCGYQDAYMTTFGGLNFLDFRGKAYYRELEEEVYAAVEKINTDSLPFVIAHTGIQHHSGDFHRPIRERWLEGEEDVVQGYQKITELAIAGKRALIDGDWEKLGSLMNKNHRIQDRLRFSGEQNNRLIDAALEGGALGAKLAGAGGGGTIIALTLEPEKTRQALKEAGADKMLKLDQKVGGLQVDEVPDEKMKQVK